jgi:hypothetical protein
MPDSGCIVASLGAHVFRQRRQVSYQQAEADIKSLAAQLTAAFGRDELARLGYVAIPRGGLLVLGMLAYVLNLDSRQLVSPPADVPVVLVDDCALTGFRFHNMLQSLPHERLIFAHLYSHPALRKGIVSQEPRVMACLAAHDLRDLARERFPSEEDYLAWLGRWRERLPGHRYWIGVPEIVLFPWNEPDRPAWNPLTEEVEDDWHLAAPDRCLKNWAHLGMPPRIVTPTLRSPDAVAFSLKEGKVTLCDLRTEEVYGAEGVGADMWRALAAYGDLDVAADYLLSRYQVGETQLRSDLRAFACELLAKGLLERVNEPSDIK